MVNIRNFFLKEGQERKVIKKGILDLYFPRDSDI